MSILSGVAHWIAANFSLHLVMYTAIALVLLYRPPAVLARLQGIGDFVSRHWGDSIGLYMIHLGILLTVVGGFYAQLTSVQHVGESFILTGVGMLKLKYIPKENGNGGNGSNGGNGGNGVAPAATSPAPQPGSLYPQSAAVPAATGVFPSSGAIGEVGAHGAVGRLGTNQPATAPVS